MYPPSQFLALALIALFVPLLTRRHLSYWLILEAIIAMQTLVVVLAYDILVFPETASYIAPVLRLSANFVTNGSLYTAFFANPLLIFLTLIAFAVIYVLVIRPSIWLARSILDARRRVRIYLGAFD